MIVLPQPHSQSCLLSLSWKSSHCLVLFCFGVSTYATTIRQWLLSIIHRLLHQTHIILLFFLLFFLLGSGFGHHLRPGPSISLCLSPLSSPFFLLICLIVCVWFFFLYVSWLSSFAFLYPAPDTHPHTCTPHQKEETIFRYTNAVQKAAGKRNVFL